MANTKITAANIDSTSTGFTFADLIVDGNVGIGDASPENRLHVKGAANTSTTVQIESASNQYAPKILFDGLVGASADYLLGQIVASWDTHTNEVAAIRFESGSDTTNKDDGLISFYTSDAGSTLDERMRIDSSGNVGIGTSSPSYPLDVRKNQAGYTYISSDNANTAASGTGSGFAMTESGTVAWYMRSERDGSGKFNIGNSANRMTIDSSGNLSLGGTASGGSPQSVSYTHLRAHET